MAVEEKAREGDKNLRDDMMILHLHGAYRKE